MCPYSEFSCSVFSRIRFEYSIQMQARKTPNMDTFLAVTLSHKLGRFLKTPPKKLAKSLPETFLKVAPVALFDATYIVIIYITAGNWLN